jgi:hypothetical protein
MRRLGFAALAALVAIGPLACDGGLQPEARCPSGICGTITLLGAQPESTDAVFVIAYRTFPQTCADIPDFVPFPPSAITLGGATATYTLSLPDGRYEWIVAAWKKVGTLTLTPADTAILREAGYYRNPADTSQAGAVTLAGAGVDGIDFVVDLANLHPITDYLTCTVR